MSLTMFHVFPFQVFERYCTVIEADVIKNFGFVHIDAEVQGRSSIEKISAYLA